jgi:ferrochelatase
LVNLGSPESPSVPDVRRYLKAFLMDERVIDAPLPMRWMIVHGFILPFRPKQSAHAYQAVKERVKAPVALAMRYGNPSIEYAVDQLLTANPTLNDINLIALYPHYAMSTVETCVVRAQQVLQQKAPQITLKVLPPFYNDPEYIDALAVSAEAYLQDDDAHLLFSYHGLPERHLRKTDPTGSHCLQVEDCCNHASPAHARCYRHQTFETTKAVVEKLGLAKSRYSQSFQSRLGRDPWLTPYTDQEIIRLAQTGVKTLKVICPAFVSDCLETLEEIGIRGKKSFLEYGGDVFEEIPCLNTHAKWIDVLVTWCEQSERFETLPSPRR